MLRKGILTYFFTSLFLCVISTGIINAADFTIVIDPGHGGKDPGALGSIVREKDVVLSIALKFGNYIKKNHADVNVIYTRDGDFFVDLEKRPKIANKAKANLFVSIHSDWAKSSTVKGASTFTLGQNRSKENFEIAKRENSVILFEDDYKTKYEGFDPNSAESYIMFEFMHDSYMDQSIKFATTVQQKLSSAGRVNRNVRQDIFLVLRNTSMPAVLVECGFLTNKEEEIFLKSEEGQNVIARSLYNAFLDFKNDYERKSSHKQVISSSRETDTITNKKSSENKSGNIDKSLTVKKKVINNDSSGIKPVLSEVRDNKSDDKITFKVQLILSPKQLPENDKRFNGIKVDYYKESGNYKYTTGDFSDFNDANQKRRELYGKFPDAFVVAFRNGIRIDLNEAKAESAKMKKKQNQTD
jgi:N-acetylmuramoyl-L-alanine amidase